MAWASLKTARSLLPSLARQAAAGVYPMGFASQIFIDADCAALRLYLSITAIATGCAGIAPVIRGHDKITGNAVELTTGGMAVTQVGTYAYEMCFAPDPPFGNIREAVSRPVPYQWDVLVKHLDLLSYTYSLSAEVLR